MSKILDGLKEAEQKRERVIAERKRLEAEADAALAAREREDRLRDANGGPAAPLAAPEPAAPQARTPEQHSRIAAGLAIAAALAVVFWVGTLVPQKPAAVAVPPPAAVRTPPALFRFDRDDAAFAARAREGIRE